MHGSKKWFILDTYSDSRRRPLFCYGEADRAVLRGAGFPSLPSGCRNAGNERPRAFGKDPDSPSRSQDCTPYREIEARERLCSFGKVDDAIVMLQEAGNGTGRVNVYISMEEALSNSEREELSQVISQYFEDVEAGLIEIKYADALR